MTNTDAIADALRPWMKKDRWYVRHPTEDAEFHHALAAAFNRVGCPLDPNELREAMTSLLAEHHPDKHGDYWTDVIDRLVQRAETIGSFLADTGGLRK